MWEGQLPDHSDFPQWWGQHGEASIEGYISGQSSYIRSLPPEFAVKFSGVKMAEILYRKLGAEMFQRAMQPGESIPSPVAEEKDGNWLRRTRTVGINVRTIGHFQNVVKYAMTLPAHVDCIHLLPIWEPGVVASLYGMASWHINPEFFSHEWRIQFPQLATVENQLKVTINLLHALGKKVGMDVIPHTDRYSEIVLANPGYFEWLRREDTQITDHSAGLHETVAAAIWNWLRLMGPAIPLGDELPEEWRVWLGEGSDNRSNVPVRLSNEGGLVPPASSNVPVHSRFFTELPEATRLQVLFGPAADHSSRRDRRIQLVDHLFRLGLEPVPATMAPPYRGLEVDTDPSALTVDDAGRAWRDYRIIHPQEMSRVFGPLTRYKLYGRHDNNDNWAIDFDQPRTEAWSYVAGKYMEVQRRFGFDFMRGDMSHVQMRPGGTPIQPDAYYDLLGYVKDYIRAEAPYFAYFAESFLTEPDYMAYGDEVVHLEASKAEVTLGNLQSMVPGEAEFNANFNHYLDLANHRKVTPAFTVITGDKDDPRFDKFYRWGTEARMFTALLLPTLPAYYALGLEQRDIHPYPFPNEYYTKLYVFHLDDGPKATRGPFQWGKNLSHFFRLDRLHQFREAHREHLLAPQVYWTLPPDPTGGRSYLGWILEGSEGKWYCLVNFGRASVSNLRLPLGGEVAAEATVLYSVLRVDHDRSVLTQGQELVLSYLDGAEAIIIQLG